MSILYLYQIDNKLRSNKTCPSQVKPCSLQFNIDFNINTCSEVSRATLEVKFTATTQINE